jgi:hypothetical protein
MRHKVEAVAAADVELTRLKQAGVEASGRWWQGRREANELCIRTWAGSSRPRAVEAEASGLRAAPERPELWTKNVDTETQWSWTTESYPFRLYMLQSSTFHY